MITLEIISLFLIASIVCVFTGFVIYSIIKDGLDLIKDIKKEHKPEDFPCNNCTAKEPGNEDFCEFAWGEYNRGMSIWDCLGAK